MSVTAAAAELPLGASASLTWPIVLVVLVAALLHAGWNALIKAGGDKALDTALIHVLASLAVLPVLVLVGPPPLAALPFLFASLLIHIGYYFALVRAYQHGELAVLYRQVQALDDLRAAEGFADVPEFYTSHVINPRIQYCGKAAPVLWIQPDGPCFC